jgi:signal transduction histidine kinase
MTAEPDEFETKVRWSLESVGEEVGADRGCVFQLQGDAFTLTTEWTADGVESRGIRTLDPDEYEWLFERLEGFENVTVADATDLPRGAATREFLQADGARSTVVLPMVDSWSLVGFVGFEVAEATKQWPASEVDVLRTAADIVAHSHARVRREQTLAEQNERLEAFASVISHDLRNPLNVVSGSLELARAETDSEHLDRATRAADRMDDLIDQVLTLARKGDDISETEEVRLGSIAERAWTAVDSGAADLRLVGELGRTEADPDRLQEAFENLFRNSVEHGSTGNRAEPDDPVEHGSTSSRTKSDDAIEHTGDDVTVRVGRSEAGFYVEDDGPGIPLDRRESVFERGESSSDGTGLGLSIVQSIVEAHGWSIRAGAGTDGGARFDVTGVPFLTE